MASEAKIAANRRNAARSTGPKTGPGKAIASLNALKTGTYAKTSSLMPGEDRDAYGKIEQEIYAQMMPVGPIEEECVRSIIEDLWKLERLRRLEAETMERHIIEYCKQQYRDLHGVSYELFLDKLFDGDEKSSKKKKGAAIKHINISQYAQEKIRSHLYESEETSKSKDPIAARMVEKLFEKLEDNNLLFESFQISKRARDIEYFVRRRQDVMRDLQKNYAFLDTLQHRRQTVEGHVTTVVVSNDTGSSG